MPKQNLMTPGCVSIRRDVLSSSWNGNLMKIRVCYHYFRPLTAFSPTFILYPHTNKHFHLRKIIQIYHANLALEKYEDKGWLCLNSLLLIIFCYSLLSLLTSF